ncbi:MAG: nitrous oxide reductase family maturation protein NosD, partial [bacterium]
LKDRTIIAMTSPIVISLILWSFSLSSAATLQVPKGYKTIQEAIDKSGKGDIVLVEAGTYPEVLSLKTGVTVKSQGSETEHTDFTAAKRTIISSPGHQAAIIQGADQAILDGFTLEDKQTGFNYSVSRSGVLINGQSQTISNCLIGNLAYDGIIISGPHPDSEALIYHNVIFNNQGSGVKCQSRAKTGIIQNQIFGNEKSGIENNTGTRTKVIGNRIYKNLIDGVMNTTAKPVIKGNDIFENGLNGIGLQSGSQGIIMKNLIFDNAQAGVGLRSSAVATVWENKIYGNMIGVGCLDLGNVKIESNEIFKNRRIGIGLMGCSGRPVTIINNHFHDNGFMPISPNPGCQLVQDGNRF